jgi:hypothetical protein
MNRAQGSGFAEARANARVQALNMRGKAYRTVAGHATDAKDLTHLVSMLGLDDQADDTVALVSGLAGYIRAVAVRVHVPPEGTGFEVSDTATGYVGLSESWSRYPDRDVMLVWGERHGWYLALETGPAELPVVLAYLGGSDVVPEPGVVAGFVAEVLAGRLVLSVRPAFPYVSNRDELARRLSSYAVVGRLGS